MLRVPALRSSWKLQWRNEQQLRSVHCESARLRPPPRLEVIRPSFPLVLGQQTRVASAIRKELRAAYRTRSRSVLSLHLPSLPSRLHEREFEPELRLERIAPGAICRIRIVLSPRLRLPWSSSAPLTASPGNTRGDTSRHEQRCTAATKLRSERLVRLFSDLGAPASSRSRHPSHK